MLLLYQLLSPLLVLLPPPSPSTPFSFLSNILLLPLRLFRAPPRPWLSSPLAIQATNLECNAAIFPSHNLQSYRPPASLYSSPCPRSRNLFNPFLRPFLHICRSLIPLFRSPPQPLPVQPKCHTSCDARISYSRGTTRRPSLLLPLCPRLPEPRTQCCQLA